jgi:opacity protein-like surface antigen
MRINKHIKKILIACMVSSPVAITYCQTEKQIVPTDIKQQTIVTEPVTLRKGYIRLGSLMNYRVADRYFNGEGVKEYYVSSIWTTKSAFNLTLQYGINDRFQVDLTTVYMNNRQKSQSTEIVAVDGVNTSQVITSKQKGLGFGDSHLLLKYQIFTESANKISLTGILDVTFPTGKKNPTNIRSANQYDLPVGNGTFAMDLGLLARGIFYPYSFTCYLGYTNNFEGSKKINVSDISEREFKFGNRIEGSVGTNLLLNEWIVLTNELNYFHEKQGKIDGLISPGLPVKWAASYIPGLVFQVKRFRLGESITIPLKGKNVPADPLFVMMVQYVF